MTNTIMSVIWHLVSIMLVFHAISTYSALEEVPVNYLIVIGICEICGAIYGRVNGR